MVTCSACSDVWGTWWGSRDFNRSLQLRCADGAFAGRERAGGVIWGGEGGGPNISIYIVYARQLQREGVRHTIQCCPSGSV